MAWPELMISTPGDLSHPSGVTRGGIRCTPKEEFHRMRSNPSQVGIGPAYEDSARHLEVLGISPYTGGTVVVN